MCLAAPSRVIELRDGTAVTECFGQTREVSLLLLGDEHLNLNKLLFFLSFDSIMLILRLLLFFLARINLEA